MRKNRRHVFGRRTGFRRNQAFSALQAMLPSAGLAIAGFVGHKIVTKLLSSVLGNALPGSFAKTITGAIAAVAGFLGLQKFAPQYANTVGLGMFASFGEGTVRELLPSLAPAIGLGNTQSLLPRYSVGDYYEAAAGSPSYYEAAAGFTEAAAGVGEYFSEGGSIAKLSGVGEYFANEVSVQGYGDYEITNNFGTSGVGVIDGVRPDSNLDAQFQYMEAAAGLGQLDRPSPTQASTYIPHENALTVSGAAPTVESGIFDQSGGNGVLG